ncbi:MAG: L-aspartate oxidase [Kiritimatiellia bacterium]|jgi:L-aspartate oxidase
MKTIETEFLIIGSGIAGLMAAHYLSPHGKVLIVTKRDAFTSNSSWAQGGISCVMDVKDSIDSHVADTLDAGAGLCNEKAVRDILEGGRFGIDTIVEMGVHFARTSDGQFELAREGGHSERRILHAGDITGHEVIKAILPAILENPNISVLEHHMAIDLVTTGWLNMQGENECLGSYFLDTLSGEIIAIRASHTILATGGAGKTYLYTSNPDVATGDGIAMAWRAGLPIRNMEHVQFHPTCLFHPAAKSFLISEAVRGEGASLLNSEGQRFVEKHDPRGSLAPRDIVARAIDHEMKTRGDTCVYLDITHKSKDFLTSRFPNIYATCLQYGIDMAKDYIPVVPAAHYICGGVAADVDGTTELNGLYAIGEVTNTGLHGANRLASNSLLEGLVCAQYVAENISKRMQGKPRRDAEIPAWEYGAAVPSDEAVVVEHNWNEVRTCMWDYVGIVRTNKRLERARRRVRNLRNEIREYYLEYLVTPDTLELRNIAAVAELIIRSAQQREESRGLHYTLDYPEVSDEPIDTVIQDPPGEQLTS